MKPLEELLEIAKSATQGEWFPCGARFTYISTELNDNEILDIAEGVG